MLLIDVQPYDSDVLHLSISTKLTDDANFCKTAETYLYTWYNLRYYPSLLDILKKIHLKLITKRFFWILGWSKHFRNNFQVKFEVNKCLKL